MLAKITSSKIVEWHSTDQESLFEKNLKIVSNEWVYRSKKIYYKFNSQGYRCPEWTDIDWKNSILLIGCSYTLGVGLAEEDTLAAVLSAIVNRPVINLGVGSSSNHLMLHNSFSLVDSDIIPNQVIALFSDVSRATHFKEDGSIKHYGNWIYPTHKHHQQDAKLTMPQFTEQELTFYKQWIQNENSDVYGNMAARSIENLWKSAGVPFMGVSAYHGQLSNRYHKLPAIIDKARDLMHPGLLTIKHWAEDIAAIL